MTDFKVAIVIPFHKKTLSPLEQVSLDQLKKTLSTHTLIVVKPESGEMPAELTQAPFLTETFDDKYFKDPKGYNNLAMATEFYERFLNYDFMLIYQLDVFVLGTNCKIGVTGATITLAPHGYINTITPIL
jgi:hypothetical protein